MPDTITFPAPTDAETRSFLDTFTDIGIGFTAPPVPADAVPADDA